MTDPAVFVRPATAVRPLYRAPGRRQPTKRRTAVAAAAPGPRDIFIYDGAGSSASAVWHTEASLAHELPHHTICRIGAAGLREPAWRQRAALLVMPGGRDLPYVHELNGAANGNIAAYVLGGGNYLGICAGAYYGSGRVEFAMDEAKLKVCGQRELRFYPGTCRGPLLPGFSYHDHFASRALTVSPQKAVVFYHGGGYFVAPHAYANVDVVAWYAAQPEVAPMAAVVACRVGSGMAVLSGVHAEFVPQYIPADDAGLTALRRALLDGDGGRQALFAEMLSLLKLQPIKHGCARRPAPSSFGPHSHQIA